MLACLDHLTPSGTATIWMKLPEGVGSGEGRGFLPNIDEVQTP